MPTEKVIAAPLSGDEIRKAILDRIDTRLQKDGYLNPALAYLFYEMEGNLKVRCHDVGGISEINVPFNFVHGEPPAEVDEVVGKFLNPPLPPNTERVQTGQPVHTESGNKIKYGRDKAKK
jgi:hypothetical protein